MRNGGNQRLIEFAVLIAVTVLVASGLRYLNEPPKPNMQTSFIVPSQTVRW